MSEGKWNNSLVLAGKTTGRPIWAARFVGSEAECQRANRRDLPAT